MQSSFDRMLGILSDAHGNAAALERGLAELRAAGASRFVFLGDALGYFPHRDTLDVLRALGDLVVCIRGNHERLILEGTPDPARDVVYQHGHIRHLLGPEDLAWIGGWPSHWELDTPRGRALFVHGSPADPTDGYVYPDTDLARFTGTPPFVFMGHTHRPFIRVSGDTTFVNVGSVGMPRDVGTLGACGLFDTSKGAASLLRFDIREETRRTVAASRTVHPSVLALLDRGTTPIAGDVVA